MIKQISIGLVSGALAVLVLALVRPQGGSAPAGITYSAAPPPAGLVYSLARAANPPARALSAGEAATARTVAAMEANVAEVRFKDVPFSDVVRYFRERVGGNLLVKWGLLEAAGIEGSKSVTVDLRNVPLASALQVVLDQVGGNQVRLGYYVENGVVYLTTNEEQSRHTVTRVYDVRDLIDQLQASDLNAHRLHFRRGWPFLQLGTEGMALPTDEPAASSPGPPHMQPTNSEVAQLLIISIEETIDRDSWRDAGGSVGSIREFSGMFIIIQTPEGHGKVERALAALRARKGEW